MTSSKTAQKPTGNWKRLLIVLLFLGGVFGLLLRTTKLPTLPKSTNNTQTVPESYTTDSPNDQNEEAADFDNNEQNQVLGQQTTDLEVLPSYKVVYVSDGDTIKVDLNGKTETIRLLGIDSPEIHDPRTGVQCYGFAAKQFANNALLGKQIKLVPDPTQQDRDKYQRLLRYIFTPEGTNFNLTMVSEGYATEFTYINPYIYSDQFKAAQTAAMSAKKGLWNKANCP